MSLTGIGRRWKIALVLRLMPRIAPFALVSIAASMVASCSSTEGGFSKTFMSLDSNGDRPRTTFFTDTVAIYCGGTFTSSTTDVTVNATIREVSVANQKVDVVLAVGEQAPGKGTNTVVFQLNKVSSDGTSVGDNQPWPVGSFVCDLSVNGRLKDSLDFNIAMPDCPAYPAVDGQLCQGFYPVGQRCAAPDQSMSCTCEPSGTWGDCS